MSDLDTLLSELVQLNLHDPLVQQGLFKLFLMITAMTVAVRFAQFLIGGAVAIIIGVLSWLGSL
jgi:hypothetical protein